MVSNNFQEPGSVVSAALTSRFLPPEAVPTLDQIFAKVAGGGVVADDVTAAWPTLASLATELCRNATDPTWTDIIRRHPIASMAFDLAYAAGLYDYLSQETAKRLTTALFAALKPGGRLVFANFAAGIREEGYMAALMDWRLMLREDEDLRDMLADCPETECLGPVCFGETMSA